MKGIKRIFWLLSAIVQSLLIIMIFTGCTPSRSLYLQTQAQNRILHQQKDNIDVTLELSKNSLVDNKLVIVNNTSSPIDVSPQKILFEIPKKLLEANAVEDYISFLDRRSKRLQSLCYAGDYQYVCSDEIRDFYQSQKSRAFIFGTIMPGNSSRGNIAFDMPLVVNNSKWKAVEKTTQPYKARVTFQFIVNRKPVTITFPLLVTCDDIGNLPYSVLEYLK